MKISIKPVLSTPKSRFSLAFIVMIVAFAAFFAAKKDVFEEAEDETAENGAKKLDDATAANDWFFQQRAYPDASLDWKVYEQALQNARMQVETRGDRAGFNEPWTTQGPGNSGARINVVASKPDNDDVILAGYSAGGLYRTADGGSNWVSVFEDKPYLAISTIHFDPVNPNIVYAGTGDANISGYPFIGDGIYKSTDAGVTWVNIGLKEQRIISKIKTDPKNGNIIYAASMGTPFERNDQRGLFKSIDGGKNWKKILYVSDQAGIIDLIVHPKNPLRIYAAAWDRIRTNKESKFSGANSRIFRSDDGGDTWKWLREGGIPLGEFGRIAIASPDNNDNLLYALYATTSSNLHNVYRSNDGGTSWAALPNDETNGGLPSEVLGGQGWYFGKIFVNPTNENDIFVPAVELWRSRDVGKNWSLVSGANVHPDVHDIAVLKNGKILLATDGGLYRSKETINDPTAVFNWDDIENIATTQFYRVAYNPHDPTNYYGGTQDNGTVRGNSKDINFWKRVFGADGFLPVFHPKDPNTFYVEIQNGGIIYTTDGGTNWNDAARDFTSEDRKNWDMPYNMSPHNPDVLYAGTHRFYKSTVGARPSWIPVSDDLTKGNTYGARFHTITTLDESPKKPDIIYAGTSDGNVWTSTNGTKTWKNIAVGLPDRYVTCVKASPTQDNTVFVTHSGYRDNENTARIHRSKDNGTTWENIAGDLPALAINDLLVLPNLQDSVLFVATDGGVYASTNSGKNWQRLGNNLPQIPVYDLEFNPTQQTLMAGTYARSLVTYPIDKLLAAIKPLAPLIPTCFGQVTSESKTALKNIFARRNSTSKTSDKGCFEANADFPINTDYEIKPYRNENWLNGVSTFDMVLIQRHILDIEAFASPYKVIAADVNKSGNVTIADVVEIRKALLRLQDTFPNNQSWRFALASYQFPEVATAATEKFPETYTLNFAKSQYAANFIGIKTGDVNESATPSANPFVEERSDKKMLLVTENALVRVGESFYVDLNMEAAAQVQGIQFALKYPTNKVVFEGVQAAALPDFSSDNIQVSNGKIGVSWAGNLHPFNKNETCIRLTFRALQTGLVADWIQKEDTYLRGEWYNDALQTGHIQLNLKEHAAPSTTLLYQNEPNPAAAQTNIRFTLPDAGNARLSFTGVDGRVIKVMEHYFERGTHHFSINTNDFGGYNGVLYYTLTTKTGSLTKKMVVR
jgi:photosystem II stability/assembly factor-like uncharacterized protein